MRFYVYVLRCGDGSLYTGIARDVGRRFAEHVTGRGARYTRGRGPLRVAHAEGPYDKGDALRRELAIKALPRSEKEAMCGA